MYEVERFGSDSEGCLLAYRVVRRHGRAKLEVAGTFSCELHGTLVAREQAKALCITLNAITHGFDAAMEAANAKNQKN